MTDNLAEFDIQVFNTNDAPYFKGTINLDKSNMQLWLDAADESTIDADSDGAVNEWRDKSGNSNHAAPVNNHKPKILSDSKLDGAKVMQFVYKDYFGIPELKDYSEGELYIVVRVDTDGAYYGGFHSWGNDINQHYAYAGDVYENFGRDKRIKFTPLD